MKKTKYKIFRLFVALFTLMFATTAIFGVMNVSAEGDTINYVSLGDSMTNGLMIKGYDKHYGYGYRDDAYCSYPNQFAEYLATETGKTVNHHQLAMSNTRIEDVNFLLQFDLEDEKQKEVASYASWYTSFGGANRFDRDPDDPSVKFKWPANGVGAVVNSEGKTLEELWNETFLYGDRRTADVFVDSNWKNRPYIFTDNFFTDQMLPGVIDEVYNYYDVNATDVDAKGKLEAAIRKNPTPAFAIDHQITIAEADIISIANGNANFGVFMMEAIMMGGIGFGEGSAENYNWLSLDRAIQSCDINTQIAIKEIKETLYNEVMAVLGDNEMFEFIYNALSYAVVSYLVNYTATVDRIMELNPDAEVILMGIMNTLEGVEINAFGQTLPAGDLMYNALSTLNTYAAAYPTIKQLMGDEAYSQGKFYYAEASNVECIVSTYKELLEGEEGIGRSRAIADMAGVTDNFSDSEMEKETITGTGMIWQLMKSVLPFTLIDTADGITVGAFEEGLIEYMALTTDKKAEFVLGHMELACSYEVYLAFENGVCEAGKKGGTVNLEDVLLLGNIFGEGVADKLFGGVMTLYGQKTTDAIGNIYSEVKTTLSFLSEAQIQGICTIMTLGDALGHSLAEDDRMGGLINFWGRCVLGVGAGSHPNEQGHETLANAIINAYENDETAQDYTLEQAENVLNMLLTYVSENYEGIYEFGYAEADKAGYIALAASKVAEFKEELEVVKAWVAEAELPADIKAEINAEIAVAEATLAQIVEVLVNDKASTVAGLEQEVKSLLATASEAVEHLNHLIKLASDDAYELITNKLNELQLELETLANKAIDEAKAFAEEVEARIVEELKKAEADLKEALAQAKAEVEAYVAEVTAEMNAELARIYAEIAAEITARIEAAVEYAEAVYTNVTEQVEYVVAQAKAIVEAVVAETKAKIAEVEAAINKVQSEVKAALAKVEEVSKEVYNEIVEKVDEVLSVAKAIAAKVEMFEECLEEIEAIIKAEIEALPEDVQAAIANAEAKVLEYFAGKAAEFGAAYEAYAAVVKAYLEEIKAEIIEAYETAETPEEFLVMAAAIIASEIDEVVEYVEGKYLEAKAVVEAVKAEIAEIIAQAQATYLEAKEALIEAQKEIESTIAEIKAALEIVKAEIEAALAEIKAESEEIYAKVMVEVEKAIAKAEALAKEVEAAIEYAEYLKGVILEQIEIAKGDLRAALAEAKVIAEAKLAEIYAELSAEAQKIYEEVTAKVFAEVTKAIAYAEYVYEEAELVASYVLAELEVAVAEINAELYAEYLEVEAVVEAVIENSEEIIASVLAEIEANKVEIIIALDEALNELADVMDEVVAEVLSTYNGIRAEVRALIEMLGEHAPVEQILAAYDELTANIEDVLVVVGEDAIEILKAYQKLSAFVKEVIERLCAEYEGEHFEATEDTKYLALGDSLVLATGLESGVSYSDKVAEALGLSNYALFGLPGFRTNDLHYLLNPEVGTDEYYETVILPEMEGVVVEELNAIMLEAVETSDIITLQVGANNFGAYALSQLVAYMTGEEMYEMDWDKYTGYELSEVAAEIKAEYTDDLFAYVYEQTGFAMPEEMLPMATTLLDVVLFTSLEYAANLEAIVDIIHERNEEAYLVLVGTYNPLRGVYYDDGETAFEVGTLVEAVTSVIDAYIEQLAAEEENCVYVAINETEMILDTLPAGYVSKNLADTVEIPFVGVSVPEFLLEVLGNDFETLHPSEAGHEYIKDQIIATISHEVSEEWTSDETGHWHACAGCEEQFDFAEHTFEWVIDEEAKPGVAGSKHEECTECGYKQNEGTEIEALPEEHVHEMTKIPANPASCTEKGNNEYYYCAGCGKYFKDAEGKVETTKEAEELPMTEHVYGEWVEVEPATEDQPGLEERTCVCGEKETREIPQLEHVHEMEVIKSTPSTCISHGNYKYYHCEKCDKYFKDAEGKEETTPADRVKPLGGHVGGQATCEDRAQCIICGETYGAYGTHVLEYVAEVPATHKEAGTKAHYACECCGELQDAQGNVITEKDLVINKVPHSATGEWVSNETGHWHECSCGEQLDFTKHAFEWVIDEEAKPGVAGSKHEECKACGYKQNEGTEIPALSVAHEHDMEKVAAKEASCEEDGNNEYYYCAGCGKYFKDAEGKEETTKEAEVIKATGHTYGEWVVVKEATENEPGLEERTCSCGEKETREIPQLPAKSKLSGGVIALIVVGSLAVLGGGGFALWFFFLKKKFVK